MKRLFFLTIIILSGVVRTLAVTDYMLTANDGNIVPESPRAARFLEVTAPRAALVTGATQFDIPLYNLNVQDLSIPFSLKYLSNGIKVYDDPCPVSYGWSLLPALRVTRRINGRPDELFEHVDDAPKEKNEMEYTNCYRCVTDSGLWTLDDYTSFRRYDAEKDIFTIHLPNKNVTCLADFKNGTPEFLTVNNSDIRIEADAKLSYIMVTDSSGSIFKFGRRGEYSDNTLYCMEWVLTEITLLSGDKIAFEWKVLGHGNKNHRVLRPNTIKYNYDTFKGLERYSEIIGADLDYPLVAMGDFHNQLELSKVTFPTGVIDLAYVINKGGPHLTSFTVSNTAGDIVKTVALTYDNNVLLTAVDISDTGRYDFDYYHCIVSEYQQDLWGFYNGDISAITLVPEMQVRAAEGLWYLTTSGSSRECDEDYMKHRLLRKVTYPTGGYSEWTHETHRFKKPDLDPYIQKFVKETAFDHGGGLRVKTITTANDSTDTSPVTTDYVYGVDGDGLANYPALPILHTFITGMEYVTVYWDDVVEAFGQSYTNSYLINSLDLTINTSSNYLSYRFGATPMWYSKVTEITGEGKTEHYFEQIVPDDVVQNNWLDIIPCTIYSTASKGPQETKTIMYKGLPGNYTKISTITSKYEKVENSRSSYIWNHAIHRKYAQSQSENDHLIPDFGESMSVFLVDKNFEPAVLGGLIHPGRWANAGEGTYCYHDYTIRLLQERLVSQTTTEHFENGDMTSTVAYSYRPDSEVPVSVTATLADGSTRKVELFYPTPGNNIGDLMIGLNLGNTPVKTSLTETCSGSSVTKSVENIYGTNSSPTVPRVTETRAWRGDNQPMTLAKYYYGRRGNLEWRISRDNVQTIWSWDKTGTYPIRQNVANKFFTYLEWKGLVGVTAQTTPFGSTTRYEYDNKGRLVKESLDDFGTLNTYAYNLTRGAANIRSFKWLDASGSTKVTTTAHFDGLGRQWLSVAHKAGGTTTDVATLTEYDSMSRPYRKWSAAPVAAGEDITPESFASASRTHYNDNYPFTEITYEQSERRQVERQTPPGTAWHTSAKAKTSRILTNDAVATSRYACPLFEVGNNRSVVYKGLAPAATLVVTEQADEDGHTVLTFTDGRGRTLLTRSINGSEYIDTRYVYNGFDDLVCVLPPMLANRNYAAGDKDIDRYAYFYEYDAKGQCTVKKFPGRDEIHLRYDPAGRLVASQDGNQRKKGGMWTLYLYDVYGRDALTASSGALDEEIDAFTSVIYSVSFTGDPLYAGYTPTPDLPFEPLVRTAEYYDDYAFTALCPELRNTDSIPGVLATPLGLRTGGYAGAFEIAYYDNFGRQICRRSNTPVGTETFTTRYTYSGQISSTTSTVGTESVTTDYGYNYVDRLTVTSADLSNASSPARLTPSILPDHDMFVSMGYDATGILNRVWFGGNVQQVVTRDCGGRETSRTAKLPPVFKFGLQRTPVLNPLPDPDISLTTCDITEQLLYADADVPCFNGNVAARKYTDAVWKYTYDNLNRLVKAKYTSNDKVENFSTAYSYDKHSNITRMEKYGIYDPVSRECALIDDLELSYDGNQAVRVEDFGYDPVFDGAGGYNAPDGVGELTYDANGNVTRDTGRGITRIEYNDLNLPVYIYFADGHLQSLTYNARGQKLTVTYSTATTPVLSNGMARRYKTDYVRRYGAGRVMRGDSLEMVIHPHGYFDGEGKVRYYLHDFQGNVTMTVDKDGNVLQHNRYYPYGEAIDIFTASEVSTTATAADRNQPYLYEGKELERMHGLDEYDYSARRLPGRLPLWTTQDPCLEKYFAISPYTYCAANPIRYIDPSGNDIYKVDTEGYITLEEPTTDDFDTLIATKTGKSMNLEKGSLMDCTHLSLLYSDSNNILLECHSDVYTIDNKTQDQDPQALYKFLSSNTNVEWSLTKLSTGESFIGTSHFKSSEATLFCLINTYGHLLPLVTYHSHSHPRGTYASMQDLDNIKKIYNRTGMLFDCDIYNPIDDEYYPYNIDSILHLERILIPGSIPLESNKIPPSTLNPIVKFDFHYKPLINGFYAAQ